jgi:transposase
MYSQASVDAALRLSDIGVTDREIAQIFGVSVAVIQRWRFGQRRLPQGSLELGRLPAHDVIRSR